MGKRIAVIPQNEQARNDLRHFTDIGPEEFI